MKVLLAEDSLRLQKSISTGLKRSGFAVDATGDGLEALHLARENTYDVIVLDIMLPGMDGLTILQTLRKEGRDTHILMLTALDKVDDRVRGLRLGADDYLSKPFAFDELLARVEALCRRTYGQKSLQVVVGCLELDLAAKEVKSGGVLVELTPREYMLLELLAMRLGEVVSRTEIETHIYDDLVDPMSNVVDSAICNLRKKLNVGGPLIHTRRGLGYVLQAE